MQGRPSRILIVGLGLIGGSYAIALRKAGCEVGAITRSRESLDYAIENEIIDSGSTEVTGEYLSRFDTVVFCLYPHVLLDWIAKWQHLFAPGTLLTDVTGVKVPVVEPIQKMLRKDLEFVGAHPMAGRELSGVRNADPSVFIGANYLVTPTPANTEEALQKCEELGRMLGFGRISRMSPAEHDEMVGFLSQLTHCIAVSLMTCKENAHLSAYTGDSFRDLTRIARINESMWSELFLDNKKELLAQMDLFIRQFTRLRDAVDREDTETMKDMMRLSTERRKMFDK